MSKPPLHPQAIGPAPRPRPGRVALALVAGVSRAALGLSRLIVKAGPVVDRGERAAEARAAQEAYEARQQAAQRLASDPHFVAGL